MLNPIRIYRYASPTPGPSLLVTGAIHGDEICGPSAISEFVQAFEKGALSLLCGSVTFVPLCNPLAFEQGKRFVDHNLNRDLKRHDNPQDYEDHLANILCPLLEETDYLLDIHSYDATGPAFIWAGPEGDKEAAFRHCIGTDIELFGWADAYAKILGQAQDTTSTGTTEYARRFGATGFTLECGPHSDPQAVTVAKRAIMNALFFLKLCQGQAPAVLPKARVKLTSIYWAQDAGRLAKEWHHLDPVKKGEPLAYREKGDVIEAPSDGFIIFPLVQCPVGQEWFYFGISA